ncbi:porin family protein [Hymenobacter cavernae]|uniref:Outer membrane protein beta-barrel domain-containing protein n=1 Tax=Hymenobacter cavernae TaxID=2044852 RepID=A0ABQ1TZN6_9BACT|nr:porin family protein [Hymenobacter cavernae]GGF05087.1 hypothetical protein GCM10011383_15260 [Hymenobacter cavernae]
MKRIIITLTGLLLTGAAQAQMGIRVGANAATVSAKTDDEFQHAEADSRLGYQVGVFYQQKLTKRISLVPEVQFSRQRTRLRIEESGIADGGYEANYRLRLSYLNVPVLARASFGRFYVEAGPQVGLLLAAHEKGNATYGTIAGTHEAYFNRPATDGYHKLDVGLCSGAGVQLPAGFGLSVRSYTGLRSITDKPQNVNYYGKLRNQVVQASLSYQFSSL